MKLYSNNLKPKHNQPLPSLHKKKKFLRKSPLRRLSNQRAAFLNHLLASWRMEEMRRYTGKRCKLLSLSVMLTSRLSHNSVVYSLKVPQKPKSLMAPQLFSTKVLLKKEKKESHSNRDSKFLSVLVIKNSS